MILDTNAISAMADRDPALLSVIGDAEVLALPYVAIAEFHYGLLGSVRPETGLTLIGKLAETLPVLFADFDTIGHYARIADGLKRKGRIILHNDVWLAALAIQHNLSVLSRDKHFDFVGGLSRVSW